MADRRLVYLTLLVVVIGIASIQVYANYLLQMSNNSAAPSSGTVSVLVNYGNGTLKWYNMTNIGTSGNFYDLTVHMTGGNINATFYGPPLSEHYVTGINRVVNHSPYYWTLWIYCQKLDGWVQSPVGADLLHLANGDIFSWAYEIPYHSPMPGTRTVDSCS